MTVVVGGRRRGRAFGDADRVMPTMGNRGVRLIVIVAEGFFAFVGIVSEVGQHAAKFIKVKVRGHPFFRTPVVMMMMMKMMMLMIHGG